MLLATLNYQPLWLGLGLANVVAGIVMALRSPQSRDLRLVAEWCRDWLVYGVNPYPGFTLSTNYPPYAVVFLSPLALVPHGLLTAAWAISNAALAASIGWLGIRLMRVEGHREHAIHPSVGLFLAWESVRIGLELGQFTLISVACGLAAVASRGKTSRGILLAIAMIKPQVGAAFVLWAILDGAVAPVLMAGGSIAAGTIVFAARLGQSPLAVTALYGDVLRRELSSPGFRQGALELRPLIHDLVGQPRLADAVHLGIVAGTLMLLVVAHRRMPADNRRLFLLPLTCLWTLMSVYHASYDLVLLWPVAVSLFSWQSEVRPRATVVAAVAALQLALVVDIPGLSWKLNHHQALTTDQISIAAALQHFDRLLVLALFAAILAVSTRWQATKAESVPLPTDGRAGLLEVV